MLAAVAGGEPLNHPDSTLGSFFHLSRTQIALALCVYGFIASVLPVWLLLAPRGYLSSFTKIGTILLLAFGVMIVNPELKMPALTEFAGGGGPIIPGPLFPFAFITIACGAISGFHALISSGTTSKMIDKETDIRPIGYGAMLVEGVVGIMALVAATAMPPGDYFAINVAPAAYEQLTFQGEHVAAQPGPIEAAVGEKVEGRTGGAVSLAVGMAMIFSALPGMSGLLSYWYHFAIMFEALFILTTIDSGTRVGRFLMQEALGRVYAPFARTDWMPGAYIATGLMVSSWGYFVYTGEIGTIWPMFGVANQLLGCVALAMATTILINQGKVRYTWVTLVPFAFLAVNTFYGGFLNVRDNYWPRTFSNVPSVVTEGYVLSICTVLMMILAVVILGAAFSQVGQRPVVQRPRAAAGGGLIDARLAARVRRRRPPVPGTGLRRADRLLSADFPGPGRTRRASVGGQAQKISRGGVLPLPCRAPAQPPIVHMLARVAPRRRQAPAAKSVQGSQPMPMRLRSAVLAACPGRARRAGRGPVPPRAPGRRRGLPLRGRLQLLERHRRADRQQRGPRHPRHRHQPGRRPRASSRRS